MVEEFMVTGYCRVTDQSRILVCEPDGERGVDTGCRYPACDFADSCALAAEAVAKARELWGKEDAQ